MLLLGSDQGVKWSSRHLHTIELLAYNGAPLNTLYFVKTKVKFVKYETSVDFEPENIISLYRKLFYVL